MEKHRVYGKKIDIEKERTKNFYNERAMEMDKMDNPYVAVLLGDQNPEYAKKWNDFEKEVVLPKLQVKDDCKVLDLGCGIGRWAETLIPKCGYYCGVDLSPEMVSRAKERNQFDGKEYDFFNYSFEEFCELDSSGLKYKFDRLLVCGVMMYINDEALRASLEKLLDKLDDHVRVYFTETIALEERLTLNRFYSSALKTDYDVIYRTEEQYNDIYQIMYDAGFKIVEQGLLPHLNAEQEYSETDRWYTILER